MKNSLLFMFLLALNVTLRPMSFAVEVDADLPQPFDTTTLTPLLNSSPFNRAINPADALVLTGLAYVNGKPIAHLLDTETKKTHILSDVANRDGWTLLSALPARDFKQALVKIQIGGETVTIRTNNAAVMDSRKGGSAPPSGSDRGPRDARGPSKEDKGYSRGHRGPSKEDIERFQAMSPEAQDKVKNFFRENRDKFMGMNEDDRRNINRSNDEKIANEDGQRKGGAAPAK